MKSMTGFGRGQAEKEGHLFTVEIKTVNHRYHECSVRMSTEMGELEGRVRKLLKERFERGKVDVSIQHLDHSGRQGDVWINESRMSGYVEGLREAGAKFGLKDDLTLSRFLNMPDVVVPQKPEQDTDALWECLEEALTEAADKVDDMRLREGAALKKDFEGKLSELEEQVKEIEQRAPLVVENYRTKLYERMRQYLDPAKIPTLDEERLETEVALFADRCCIDEEITRLKSHIRQYRQMLEETGPVGRAMDFLTQELNRETNTIASKSNDGEITRHALAMKNIVEKIREQVQNVE